MDVSAVVTFLHDGDTVIAEYNGTTGAPVRRYIPGPAQSTT